MNLPLGMTKEKPVQYFVIGAMKAGTSSIFHNLKDIEQISFGHSKEPNLFIKDYSEKALKEYEAGFNKGAVQVDVSPSYSILSKYPDVPKRIFQYNPGAKIIYILRDPVERIVSHLHHDLFRSRMTPSQVNEVVFRKSEYVNTSLYYQNLIAFRNYFPKENFLILTLEAFKSNPSSEFDRLFDFLQLNIKRVDFRSFNASNGRYRVPFHDQVSNMVGVNQPFKIYKQFWKAVNLKVSRPILSEQTLTRLRNTLTPDASLLEMEFDVNISKWENLDRQKTRKDLGIS